MADVLNVLGKYGLRPEEVEGVSEGGSGASGYVVAFKDPAALEKKCGTLPLRDSNFTAVI